MGSALPTVDAGDAGLSGLRQAAATRGYAAASIELRTLLSWLGAEDVTADIATAPHVAAPPGEPFNRPEPLGWHGDFSTRADRPPLTLSYVDRADPGGLAHGAWRVASCDDVLARLGRTAMGTAAVRFLLETPIAFALSEDESPRTHCAIEVRNRSTGRLGFRFYGRGMRLGARLVCGHVPQELEHAIAAVERAADEASVTIPATQGAVLLVDNWHCLHDRLAQTVDPALPLRRALLWFLDYT